MLDMLMDTFQISWGYIKKKLIIKQLKQPYRIIQMCIYNLFFLIVLLNCILKLSIVFGDKITYKILKIIMCGHTQI